MIMHFFFNKKTWHPPGSWTHHCNQENGPQGSGLGPMDRWVRPHQPQLTIPVKDSKHGVWATTQLIHEWVGDFLITNLSCAWDVVGF